MTARPNTHTRQNTKIRLPLIASRGAVAAILTRPLPSNEGEVRDLLATLTDAEVTELLYRIASAQKSGLFDYPRCRDLVLGLFRHSSTLVDYRLENVILRNDPRTALKLLGDRTVPLPRRLLLLAKIGRQIAIDRMTKRPARITHSWEDWQPIVQNFSQEPELAAKAIEILATTSVINWSELLQVARSPDLSFDLRRSLYQAFWRRGIQELRRSPGAVDAIFTFFIETPDAADVACAALPDIPEIVPVAPDATHVARIVELLKDERLSGRYRFLLSWMLAPVRDQLDMETHKQIVEIQLSHLVLLAADAGDYPVLRESIARHAGACGQETLRSLAYDERLPLHVRLRFLENLDHRAFFQFAQRVPLTADARLDLANIMRRRCFPVHLRGDLKEIARKGEQAWEELIATPEFQAANIAELVRFATKPDISAISRELARSIVMYAARYSREDVFNVYDGVLTALSSPELSSDSRNWLLDAILEARAAGVVPAATLDRILQAFDDPTYPAWNKIAVLERMAFELIQIDPRRVWDVVNRSTSPGLRGELLRRLSRAGLVLPNDEVSQAITTLTSAEGRPRNQEAAEHAWQKLKPLGDLLGADSGHPS